MTAVVRHLRSARRGRAPETWWPWAPGLLVVAAVLAAAVAQGAAWLEPHPPTVPAIVLENPGGRSVTVAVRAADDGDASTLALGQVPAGGSAVFHEVLDLGEDWMLMLSYGPVSAGELRVGRRDLEQGWAVPEAVTTHFDQQARPPRTSPGS